MKRCCAVDPLIRIELEEELKKRLDETPSEQSLNENSKILSGLSHPLRLKMAFLLLKTDYCVCELIQLTRKKQNLVSHHLSVMRKSGVVDSYMKSKWKYYKINENAAYIIKGIKK